MDGVNEGNNRAGFHRRGKRNRTIRQRVHEKKKKRNATRKGEKGVNPRGRVRGRERERERRRGQADTVVGEKERTGRVG